MNSRKLTRPVGRPRLHPHLREPSRLLCGAQIKEFRAAVDISQEGLARLMQVNSKSIYYWERGDFPPTDVMWAAFVRVRRNYQQKLRRQGKDLDGGPVIEDKS